MYGSPCELTSFFPIVDVMFHSKDMLGQSSKSVLKKAVFALSRSEVDARVSSDQICK